jgi:hypothetical protein
VLFGLTLRIVSFVLKFDIYATDVIKIVTWQTDSRFRLMQQLSADMTSAALLQNNVFPNVTHPHFDISAGYADGFGGLLSAVYAPIISNQEREQWEDYSRRNTWWIDESNELRVVHPGHLYQSQIHYLKTYVDIQSGGNVSDNLDEDLVGANKHNVSEYVFRLVNGTKVHEPSHSATTYAPLWQVSPPEPGIVNVNLFSDSFLYDLYTVMIAMNGTVQSKSTNLVHMFEFVLSDDSSPQTQPHTFIAEPVYDIFSKSAKIVGVLLAVSPFDNLMSDVLDENAEGVVCVITDNCGSVISYEINGPNVTFLGYGDLHDPNYDEFEHLAMLESYTSVVEGLCFHEVHVYPSSIFAQNYVTNQPGVYASIVALSFFLMAVVIYVYDQMITKRQEKTMRSALRSGALVASLFPANVRDRLMDDIDARHRKRGKDEKHDEIISTVSLPKSRPIADLFTNTTLMCTYVTTYTLATTCLSLCNVTRCQLLIYQALQLGRQQEVSLFFASVISRLQPYLYKMFF